MSLSASLTTAARSLEVFRTGIEVAGQNIANANTPGYLREELIIEAGPDYRLGNQIRGTGSRELAIRVGVNSFLESRLHTANTDLANSEARSDTFSQLESILAELGEGDLSTSVNNFLGALNDFANEPELSGLRQVVTQQAEQFIRDVTNVRAQTDRLRESVGTEIESLVQEANILIERVEELNVRIVRVEAGGTINSDAAALRGERLEALDRLSELISIRVEEQPSGRVDVLSGGEYLILGGVQQGLETFSEPSDPAELDALLNEFDEGDVPFLGVRFAETKFEGIPAGEISGRLSGRNEILGEFVDNLDDWVGAFVFEFNKIHSGGQGLTGYTELTSHNAVDDATVALNAAGLQFTPEHGSFRVVLENTATGARETTQIDVDLDGIGGNDTTLNDLAASLNAVSNLTATVTADNRLQLSTATGQELYFDGDSSGVLASLGINTFFTGHNSANLAASETITEDPTRFSAGEGGGPSDNRRALQLITLLDEPQSTLQGQSLDQAYENIVFGIAQDARGERAIADGYQGFHDSLTSQREQYAGVSVDEETIDILRFQQTFQAAARLISTIDELMQILVNL